VNDEHVKSVVEAAYQRFQQAVLASASTGHVSQQVQHAISRTLQQLRTRLETDPEWMNEIIREARLPIGEVDPK
jgi:hypothetical protein